MDERQVHINNVVIRMNADLCRRGILVSFLDEINPDYGRCIEEYFRAIPAEALTRVNHKNVLHFLRDYGLGYVVEKIIKIGSYKYKGRFVQICSEGKQPNYFSLNQVRYVLREI